MVSVSTTGVFRKEAQGFYSENGVHRERIFSPNESRGLIFENVGLILGKIQSIQRKPHKYNYARNYGVEIMRYQHSQDQGL